MKRHLSKHAAAERKHHDQHMMHVDFDQAPFAIASEVTRACAFACVHCREALAITWTSTKFPHRSPEGSVLVRVSSDESGKRIALWWRWVSLLKSPDENLRKMMGIHASPLFSRRFR